VAENSAVGASLLQVRAVDRDARPNGVVSYRLESDPSEPEVDGLVRVDPVSGVISAKVGFDRESLPRIVFDVVATDGGYQRGVAHNRLNRSRFCLRCRPTSAHEKHVLDGIARRCLLANTINRSAGYRHHRGPWTKTV